MFFGRGLSPLSIFIDAKTAQHISATDNPPPVGGEVRRETAPPDLTSTQNTETEHLSVAMTHSSKLLVRKNI